MHLQRLYIERVRNLSTVELAQLQPFNIFYGVNGSGKSSILEAIHLLATGKSFRTNLVKQYIQHGSLDALIYAENADYRLGLQKKSSGEQSIRLNGNTLATQSELAKTLPIQFIDPEAVALLDSGSKPRRQLLDWLMFHVEPEFYALWLKYQRALKQRNNLLRQGYHAGAGFEQVIAPWDDMLAQYGMLIHTLRTQVLERWQPIFQLYCEQLLPNMPISLGYVAGFDSEVGLRSQLQQQRQRDIERGSTQHGPHRADMRLKTDQGAVDQVLSRGQKKLLIVALKLSQIHMLHDKGCETVVLLDDFTAELDATAQRRLLNTLVSLHSQVFMTTLDHLAVVAALRELALPSYTVFKVTEGQVLRSADVT